MEGRRRELSLTTEEELLAAQQRFASSKETPSAQLRSKAPEKPVRSEKSSGKRTQRVSWAPALGEGKEAESGAAQIGKSEFDHPEESSSGGGIQSLQKEPNQVQGSPRSDLDDFSGQAHFRIGPGTDLAAEDEDDFDDEGGGGQFGHSLPPYQPLLTVGIIKEKGFSGDGATAVTLPSARVTPFPEARHRSDGPHWGPVPKQVVEQPAFEQDVVPPFDPTTAIPLSRTPSKPKASMSKFRQALMESRKQGGTGNKPASGDRPSRANEGEKDGQVVSKLSRSIERSPLEAEGATTESYAQQALKRRSKADEGESASPSAQVGEREAIEEENRARLAAMSPAEVAAEQASLQEMLPPGVLEALRKRGAKKLAAESLDSSKNRGEGEQSAGERTAALRRQPTPMPGAILEVKERLRDKLAAVTEDESLELSTGLSGPSSKLEQSKGTPLQGGALRRQPTPLPGAIPKAAKAGASSLSPLEEEGEGDEELLPEEDLTRREALLLAAQQAAVRGDSHDELAQESLQRKDVKGMERVGSRVAPVFETAVGPAQQPPSLSSRDQNRQKGEKSDSSADTGGLRRQPTPMPSEIVSLGSERESALETLEEEGEESEVSAPERRRGNLMRQGTPYPGAIPTPMRGLDPPLETLEEEEGAEPSVSVSPLETLKEIEGSKSSLSEVNPEGVTQFDAVNASALRFNLDGTPLAPSDISSTSDEGKVAERDLLRSEGDPSALGYTLKEATTLARSTIPGQRTVALRLISAVLKRALAGMHAESAGSRKLEGRGKGSNLWARVWAYALSSDVQLAVVLRSALDDSHASVLAAAAQALISLLAFSENEFLLEAEEALWRGLQEPLSYHMQPCDRSAGVSNWGRWAARATVSTSSTDVDNQDKETVGDNAQLASADVAAGLVRMGILPRIRYILEVLGLPALDEPLLSILVAISRHSDVAAAAVRACPRLLPTLQSIFIGLPTSAVRPQVPSHAAQAKAVKLLRVLSQTDRASGAQVCDQGLLQLAMRYLVSQPNMGKAPRYSPAFSEALRLWRVCALHGLGSMSFADYYPAVCFLLEAPTGPKRGTESSPPWREAADAYLLLEALARTLPDMRVNNFEEEEESDSGNAEAVLIEWATIGPLVESACQWLEPGVVRLFLDSPSSLHALSAVLHFLATAVERNQGQLGRLENSPMESLTAAHGLLHVQNRGEECSSEAAETKIPEKSIFESLTELALGANHKEALAAVTCLQGLLRVTSALVSREETAVASSEGQTADGSFGNLHAEEPKSRALEQQVTSRFGRLAERQTQVMTCAGASHVQESAASGLGLGWGLAARDLWRRGLEVWRARAALLVRLFKVLPVPCDTYRRDEGMQGGVNTGEGACSQEKLMWRLSASLSAVRLIGPGNFKPVLSLLAFSILNAEVLEVLLKGAASLLEEKVRDKLPSAQEMRQVLLPHFASHWLRWTSNEEESDSEEDGWDIEIEVGKILDQGLDARDEEKRVLRRGFLSEQLGRAGKAGAELSVPVAGQKLPLPSDWLLSPTAVAAQLSAGSHTEASESDASHIAQGVKTLVRSGLALMLGLEACNRSEVSKERAGKTLWRVSIARKLHALSEVFCATGEQFLDADVAPLLSTLQELYGTQLASESIHLVSSTPLIDAPREDGTQQQKEGLNFAAATSSPYESFAESLAEQFAATSFGDPVFGRQLALLLRSDVTPGTLRLVVWRALADARALHLLPPIGDCLGEANDYLDAREETKEAVELYATALASGLLDRTLQEGEQTMSVAATIALQSLAQPLDMSTGESKENLVSGQTSQRNREGSEERRDAMDRSAVLRLMRSLLLGAAQSRCEKTTLAAVLNYGLDSTEREASHHRRTWRRKAFSEAAGGDRTLLQVIDSLEE